MILVDTQVVIWLATESEGSQKISRAAVDAIREARASTGVAISDKTLWELAMAHTLNRIAVKVDLRDLLETTEQTFTVLPINAAIAERSVQFSKDFPKDPADRVIAATALVHGLKLVTADWLIRNSREVPTIW